MVYAAASVLYYIIWYFNFYIVLLETYLIFYKYVMVRYQVY
jgi:hypothetical protein